MLVHVDSWAFKLACLLPSCVVGIEQARVGTDCVHFYRVFWSL